MGPALCAAVTACAVLAAGGLLSARDTVDCTHVRATDARAQAAIADGMERSATFRSLVDAISQSDLIVYVSTGSNMPAPLDGEIHFLTSVGSHRYLRILIRGDLNPWERCATVGHELQHAREVAEASEVIDNRTMDALYHRIGFGVGIDRHETDAARAVTTQVLRELTPPRTSITAR